MFSNLHMSKNVQSRTWVDRGLKILRRNVDSRCFCYVPNRWETPIPWERGIKPVLKVSTCWIVPSLRIDVINEHDWQSGNYLLVLHLVLLGIIRHNRYYSTSLQCGISLHILHYATQDWLLMYVILCNTNTHA